MPASKRLGALLHPSTTFWEKQWAEELTGVIRGVDSGWYGEDDPWVGPPNPRRPAWKPGGPSWEATAWKAMGPRLGDREWLKELYRGIALEVVELNMPASLRGGYLHGRILRLARELVLTPYMTPPQQAAFFRFQVACRWLEKAGRGMADGEIRRLDEMFEAMPPPRGRERRFNLGELEPFLLATEHTTGPAMAGEEAEQWRAAHGAVHLLVTFLNPVGRFRLGTTEVMRGRLGREAAAAWLLGALTPRDGAGAREAQDAGV